MQIIDINGKTREIVSAKRITEQIPDAINGGIATTRELVEVDIIGKTGRRWKEWYPLADFEKKNPTVKVK